MGPTQIIEWADKVSSSLAQHLQISLCDSVWLGFYKNGPHTFK